MILNLIKFNFIPYFLHLLDNDILKILFCSSIYNLFYIRQTMSGLQKSQWILIKTKPSDFCTVTVLYWSYRFLVHLYQARPLIYLLLYFQQELAMPVWISDPPHNTQLGAWTWHLQLPLCATRWDGPFMTFWVQWLHHAIKVYWHLILRRTFFFLSDIDDWIFKI